MAGRFLLAIDVYKRQPPLSPLRGGVSASTIRLFSLATFPRRPSAPQAVPGGATDSDNG